MKTKSKTISRRMPPADTSASAIIDAAVIDAMLREEEGNGSTRGTILRRTAGNNNSFCLSLLCRAKSGKDSTITEIERRFREDNVQTYTPELIGDEIIWWGIPPHILYDARRDPDNAEKLRTLHRVFPGSIFCFPETLNSITRHAVTSLVSNNAREIQMAKRWLDTVLFVHHQKGRHTISIGVRQLGLFPRLYEEIVFLKKVAVILRKEDGYFKSQKSFVEYIITLLCERLDIPPAGKIKEWLRSILSPASQNDAFRRPITAAAGIIAWCTQQKNSSDEEPSTGYQQRSIRKMISLVHSDWSEQRIRIENAAKFEADLFCKMIIGV